MDGIVILMSIIKGTVNVISSDPPSKDENAQFSTVPLKALSDQVSIRLEHFYFRKTYRNYQF